MKKTINKNNIFIALVLLGLIFVASLPAFRSGIYQGHDLSFHLGRIQAIAEELKNGQFPVRYESNAWYGHGYVSTTFYGNIFLYIPALLYMAGLPVWRAYNVYVILVNIFTALVGYYSFKGLFKSERLSIIAITLYTLSGYRLSNLYVRTALGEYTAMVFVPLVIYGVYRIYSNEEKQNPVKLTLPLIIGATGLIQSHILTTEIVAVFVLIFALINLKRTIAVIKELSLALVAVLGVNAFFLVPFISSYRSMKLYINSTMTQTSIRADGLYLKQLFGLITTGKGSSWPWSAEDEGYLNLGLLAVICFMISVIAIIFIIAGKKLPKVQNEKRDFKYVITLFVFGLISAWVSTVYFPWDLFAGEGVLDKLMSSVQYPWRYSMFQSLFFIVSAVYFLSYLGNKSRTVTMVIVGVLAIGTTGIFDYTLSWGNVTINEQDASDSWADKLYLPVDTDRDSLSNTEVIIDEKSGTVTLPVLAYRNVHVYDADGDELEYIVGDNNCIQVTYDGDYTKLYTKFVEPGLWRVSEVVSFVCIILLFFSHIKRRAPKC